jgi:hypothetical protein
MHEVDIEQTCFICPQNITWSEVICSAFCSHLQDFICRGLSVWLNTEELSASSGTDAIGHHEVLWGPSVGTVPVIMRYRLCCYSMTAVMTSVLADICTVHGWLAFSCAVDVTQGWCSHLRNTLACITICMTSILIT